MFLWFLCGDELRRDNRESIPTNRTSRTTHSLPDSKNHYHMTRLHSHGQGTLLGGRVDRRFDGRGDGLLEHRTNGNKLTRRSKQTSDKGNSADNRTSLYNRHRLRSPDLHLHNADPLSGHFQSAQYFASNCHHFQVRLCLG